MTDNSITAKSFADGTAEHIRALIHGQAERLRRLADDLDRCVRDDRDVFTIVTDANHTLAWGIANLNTDLPLEHLHMYHEILLKEASA